MPRRRAPRRKAKPRNRPKPDLQIYFARDLIARAIEKIELCHETAELRASMMRGTGREGMIGSSRETVSRTMRDLVAQEIIEVTRKIIKIHNRRDSQPEGDGGGSDSMIEVSRRVIVIQNRQALEASAGMS